jgi:plastocyanin
MMALRPFSRHRHLLWVTVFVLLASGTLLLAACGGTSSAGSGKEASPGSTQGTVTATPTIASNSNIFQVSIVGNNGTYYFNPPALTIPKGSTVIWTNMSNAPHPVNSDTDAFNSPGNLLQSDTFQMVFTTAGTYPYHCGLHPYMKGTITVTS